MVQTITGSTTRLHVDLFTISHFYYLKYKAVTTAATCSYIHTPIPFWAHLLYCEIIWRCNTQCNACLIESFTDI